MGTGFLVGTPNKHIALVTAKHVVFDHEGKGGIVPDLAYRLNDKKERSRLFLDPKQASSLRLVRGEAAGFTGPYRPCADRLAG